MFCTKVPEMATVLKETSPVLPKQHLSSQQEISSSWACTKASHCPSHLPPRTPLAVRVTVHKDKFYFLLAGKVFSKQAKEQGTKKSLHSTCLNLTANNILPTLSFPLNCGSFPGFGLDRRKEWRPGGLIRSKPSWRLF